MSEILSNVYLGCMIIGNFFEKNLKNDEYFEDEEWFGTEHCATFAKAVYTFANTVNIGMETACRKVFDTIKTCGFNEVIDHGYDDYARGFLAGQVLGIPTEDARKKAEKAEEMWFRLSYGYYQEVLNDLKNDVYNTKIAAEMKGYVEVCVYTDTLGVFSEEGLNQLGDNMIYIKVPKGKLYEYFIDTCLECFRDEVDEGISDYGVFEEWLDEYTCDDTIDLYKWMSEHNMILEIGLTYKADK